MTYSIRLKRRCNYSFLAILLCYIAIIISAVSEHTDDSYLTYHSAFIAVETLLLIASALLIPSYFVSSFKQLLLIFVNLVIVILNNSLSSRPGYFLLIEILTALISFFAAWRIFASITDDIASSAPRHTDILESKTFDLLRYNRVLIIYNTAILILVFLMPALKSAFLPASILLNAILLLRMFFSDKLKISSVYILIIDFTAVVTAHILAYLDPLLSFGYHALAFAFLIPHYLIGFLYNKEIKSYLTRYR